jgi:hypothetical protein
MVLFLQAQFAKTTPLIFSRAEAGASIAVNKITAHRFLPLSPSGDQIKRCLTAQPGKPEMFLLPGPAPLRYPW